MSATTAGRAVQTATSPVRAAAERPYSDPYVAGVGIGLMLIAAYCVAGRGLGASGAFSSVAAAGVAAVDRDAVLATEALAPYAATPLFSDWIVLEILGVIVGALVSARLAGRLRPRIDAGAAGVGVRLGAGFGGGVLMGLGARLARGCTSGLALSGGALLSVGAWIFIIACFAAGYAAAPLTRKVWQ